MTAARFSANGSAVQLLYEYRRVWFGLHLTSGQPCSCPDVDRQDTVGDYCDACRSRYSFFDGPVGDYSRWSRLSPRANGPCMCILPTKAGGVWYHTNCDAERRSVCQQG